MRCSASNRVCSEAHSGRAWFEGGDQALFSSLGESEDWGCVWAVASAPGWWLSDVCDSHKLSGTSTRQQRPGLAALLDYAREGDAIVVVGIDRLGRNAAEVMRRSGDAW